MIKLIKGNICLGEAINELPITDYYNDRDTDGRTYIEVTPKNTEELISIGALEKTTNGLRLYSNKIGTTKEMETIIIRGLPIVGYIVRDATRYFLKFGSYYYMPEWFNYGNVNIINCDLLVINDKEC